MKTANKKLFTRNALTSDAEEIAERDKLNPTFAEMVETVFEARKATLRGDGDRGRWLSPLRLYAIPKFGRMRMTEITPADIKGALAKVWREKHPTGQKALQRTRIVFRDARLMGVDCDPFTVDAPQHMLGTVKHRTSHIEATPWQDMPALYAELRDRGDLASVLALRWTILTLVRGMATRGARFDEIEGATWTVPAERVKGREGNVSDFRVPLPPEALEIASRARSYSSELLFPGHRRNPITDVGMSKALRATSIGGTVHGFRTTFRTWVQDNEACSWEVAETVLGHRIGNKVERSYARSDLLEPRRVVLESWARYVTGAGDNVIALAPSA